MVRKFVAKRRGRKPGVRKQRIWKRRAGGVARAPKHGGMYLVRKMKALVGTTTAIAGTYQITGNNCVAFGTPTAEPAGTNMYAVPFTCTFRLNDIVSATEVSNLFDRYRINWAKVKIQNCYNVANNTSIPQPYIEYLSDADDDSFSTALSLRERMGVKVKYFSATRPAVTLFCRPKPALATYQTVATTGYAVPGRSPFINMANDSVPHYAIRGVLRNMYLPSTAGVSLTSWDVQLAIVLRDVL